MKKTVRKSVCVLLTVLLLSTNAFAAEAMASPETAAAVQPRFTYISSVSVGLDIEPNGYSTCDTGVTLHESTHNGRIDMVLQRNDGSGWDDVKNWSVTDDGPDIDIEKNWYVVSGYDYRVKSTVYVYNTNDRVIEMTIEYSPVVEY